jgi:hypothetical protein
LLQKNNIEKNPSSKNWCWVWGHYVNHFGNKEDAQTKEVHGGLATIFIVKN